MRIRVRVRVMVRVRIWRYYDRAAPWYVYARGPVSVVRVRVTVSIEGVTSEKDWSRTVLQVSVL